MGLWPWELGQRGGYGSGRFRGSGGRLGTRPRGTSGGRCHIEGGEGHLLGVVGFGLGPEDGGVNIFELFGNC